MIRAVAYLLFILPTNAFAESSSRPEFSFFSSFMQMIAALSLVIGLILVTRHFSGKWFKGIIPNQQLPKHIRIVETRYLGPRKTLILVEVGGEYLLLGNSDGNLSLLKEVSIIEEIEVIDEPSPLRAGIGNLLRGKQLLHKD